ncbi:MAG: DUF2585 domain-containing protein [Salaquimonas sp.]|jgi:hypothetical protein|nr:DUF2585 domain-containing protein [Salaquimonas sp.]
MSRSNIRITILTLVIVAATAATLLAMGRVPICKCGTVKLWHGVVASSENSQHLTDWYTFSHIIHGLVFFAVLSLLRSKLTVGVRFLIALVIECGWEITENTNAIIERYRAVTISLDYYGDSVINSTADIAAMILGFWLAAKLPVRYSVALAIALELFSMWMIRDGLVLNVLMLLWPLDAVREWQAGI